MARSNVTKTASSVSKAPAKRSGETVVSKPNGRVVGATSRKIAVASGTSRKAPASSSQPPAGRTSRGRAADDPLAAERTRWLAEVVGGGKALAQLLGVSPSQTSRWAKGEERPGAVAAPLLIDLEHVLARVRLVWAEPAATTWMASANAHLAGARPVDVLRLQGVGPVLDALDAAMWGGAA